MNPPDKAIERDPQLRAAAETRLASVLQAPTPTPSAEESSHYPLHELAEAFAAGQPVRIYAPKSRGASDFAQLAQHLAEALTPSEESRT